MVGLRLVNDSIRGGRKVGTKTALAFEAILDSFESLFPNPSKGANCA